MGQMEIDTNEPIRDIIYGKNYILQNLWKASILETNAGKKKKCIKNHIDADNMKG